MQEIEPRKILIFFQSGLGNFILFTPTLRAIRQRFSYAELDMVVKDKILIEILKEMQIIDNIYCYSKQSSLIKNILSQIHLVLCLRNKKYDLVFTTFEAQHWKTAMFGCLIGGRTNIGYRTGKVYDHFYSVLLNYHPGSHEVDRHMKLAAFIGADVKHKTTEIPITEKDQCFCQTIMSEHGLNPKDIIIGMHPGSSKMLAAKRWAPHEFAEVADILWERYSAKVIIFGGPNEVQLAEEVVGLMKTAKPLNLVGKTTIGQAATVIKMCNLFISNDSGLMHVAAAVNTPTIAIFGPTDPVKNAPFGIGHTVIRSNIQCSPCFNRGIKGCDSLQCLKTITVSDVLNAVENKLMLIKAV